MVKSHKLNFKYSLKEFLNSEKYKKLKKKSDKIYKETDNLINKVVKSSIKKEKEM